MIIRKIYRTILCFALLAVVICGADSPDKVENIIVAEETSAGHFSFAEGKDIGIEALNMAYEGYKRLRQKNLLVNDTLLSLIDFSKPSTNERFFILDLKNKSIILKSLVAHGVNTGELYAEKFSNRPKSNMSSLGLYLTSNTYQGKHGYSLRIEGMDKELNSNARKRAVVIHGAKYVSQSFIDKYGRLGRSFGCPALPYGSSSQIIDMLKNGSCLFIYHPALSDSVKCDS